METVAAIRPEQWEAPGLGRWTVRDLVGHTSRALLTVEEYLGRPAEREETATPVEYYVRALSRANHDRTLTHDQVFQRGREAGASLGPDPAGAVRALAERVLTILDTADDDQLLTTAGGGMRLRAYIQTRTFELLVHTLDLAAATGQRIDPPAEPTAECLAIATALVTRTGRAADLLLALTGRRPLPSGFSIV